MIEEGVESVCSVCGCVYWVRQRGCRLLHFIMADVRWELGDID